MRIFAPVFLPLALIVASCASAPSVTPQDARNALDAADRGLAAVAPVIDGLCTAGNPKCDELRADLAVALSADHALREAVNAGGDLISATDRLGHSLRDLLIALQAAKRM